jgi:hypothetical protein
MPISIRQLHPVFVGEVDRCRLPRPFSRQGRRADAIACLKPIYESGNAGRR